MATTFPAPRMTAKFYQTLTAHCVFFLLLLLPLLLHLFFSIHSPPTEGLLVVPVGILLLLLCFYFTMHESTILATTFLSLLGLCGSCSGVFLAVMCVGAHSHRSFSLLRSPIAWRNHGLYKQKKGVIFLMGFLVMRVSWNTHACVSRTDFLGVKLLFHRYTYLSF